MSATDRALGTPGRLLLGGVALFVGLTVAAALLALLQNLVAVLLGLLVTGLLVAGVGYALYWAASTILGSGESEDEATEFSPATTTAGSQDEVDRAAERYTNGELTESEFERELEAVMADDDELESEPN
ncbi:SHOCT domain-containing protein [Haloarcula nitratireducens]|uniref:SHOCT domain-containing protein n=1 Tax=Haloarcula nitratireducens TaxID=2487749 RepID=A0AAW4P9D1_9EURY|nr:SHOCT domain-containing protein [Halomicroarcula nitratireducens]MBX0294510.1 SHOCT domain-containing protein [Halomicroarcula nitratireducens]